MNASSGAWILLTGADIQLDDRCIPKGEKTCLHRPQTRLEIADKQWLVSFALDSRPKERQYIRQRNQAMLDAGLKPPSTEISAIPQDRDIVLKSVVFSGEGLGSGTFATVFEGIHPTTGDLRVVKRVAVKKATGADAIREEVDALVRFSKHDGIIDLIDWDTSLGEKNLEFMGKPFDVYLVHRRGQAMDKVNWAGQPADWRIRRSLCHQLLAGLEGIHQAGYMHRDITPQNIILFKDGERREAALSDFGKVCKRKIDTDTCLAAWMFLPPEVKQEEKNPYNQKLDVWMLAYALTRCFFPTAGNVSARSPGGHSVIRRELDQDTQSGGLAQLFHRMLSWDPKARPSAAEAYADSCFHGIAPKQPAPESSSGKRPHRD